MKLLKNLLAIGWLCAMVLTAHAAIDPALLKPLAGDDPDARIEAVNKIAALATDDAYKLLNALKNDSLYATPDGKVFVVEDGKAFDPETGNTVPTPDGVDGIMVNNRLRGAIEGALSGFRLLSQNPSERLAAALEMQRSADAGQLPLITKALEKETDPEIKSILKLVEATANLQSPDAATRKAAVKALADSSNANLKPALLALLAMLDKNPDGTYVEPDEGVRVAAVSTISTIDARLARTEFVSNLFYGVSLGSVLLLAALGLGGVNKFLEPVAGAVLAKIAILVFIIIFIQKRPQGLFALKGRSVE